MLYLYLESVDNWKLTIDSYGEYYSFHFLIFKIEIHKKYVFILFSTNLLSKFNKKLFFKIGNPIFTLTFNFQLNQLEFSTEVRIISNATLEPYSTINIILKILICLTSTEVNYVVKYVIY